MTQMIFVNLPVTDVARSTAFYEAIGCTKDLRFSNEVASAMQLREHVVFMILGHAFFQTFTGKADPPEKQGMGFMCGRSFEDPDGHIFEPMFMDMDAAMAAFPEGPAHEPA